MRLTDPGQRRSESAQTRMPEQDADKPRGTSRGAGSARVPSQECVFGWSIPFLGAGMLSSRPRTSLSK